MERLSVHRIYLCIRKKPVHKKKQSVVLQKLSNKSFYKYNYWEKLSWKMKPRQ